MTYGRYPYGGVAYAGSTSNAGTDTKPSLSVEVAFTTDPLSEPLWETITADVRSWETFRGRNRELERFQPGRATVVLGNRDAQYDSLNVSGPHYGYLKPMRRIRIRETFNGVTYPVFDGFVDKWQLSYPGKNKDALAVVTATDAKKIWARTDMPRSVYSDEVETDNPLLWWRLDEDLARLRDGFAINSGSGGTTYDGTFVGVPGVGGRPLVVNDPGGSMQTQDSFAAPGSQIQGVTISGSTLDLLAQTVFTTEAWVHLTEGGTTTHVIWAVCLAANPDMQAVCGYLDAGSDGTGQFVFVMYDSTFTNIYGVMTPDEGIVPGSLHHVVAAVEPSGQMVIYLDGTRYTTLATVVSAVSSSLSGVTRPTGGHLTVAHEDEASSPLKNWQGEMSNFAIYLEALTEARVNVHYDAGTHPWQGDLPSERIDRALDEAEWPSTLRELDAGLTTFQSAEINGQTVLEHVQKAAESEYAGLLFVTRDGKARFVDRTHVFAREPGTAIYGDTAGEVGYSEFTPDDGDEVIRNRAKVSRLNGAVRLQEDSASLSAFGPFEFVLEGLLHDSEQGSTDYAAFIVDQYADQRRRITELQMVTPVVGTEGIHYPGVLGPELGDAITVRNNPLNGDAFEQVCVVEGIRQYSEPGVIHETTFTLSPELV